MEIKKHSSLRRGYLNYSFESKPEDLSNDVIEACRLLKKGVLIAEVFSKDPINSTLLSNGLFICRRGNFNYYLCNNVHFFRMISFANARYICIYSVLNFNEQQIDRRYLNDSFTFCICFENYLNTSQLLICTQYYSDSLTMRLLDAEE